jgi:general secretion pathway protein I
MRRLCGAGCQPATNAANCQPATNAANCQPATNAAGWQPAPRCRGFTLLEVILALAIMAGAFAVLGELLRLGMQSARAARDTARAQLLCESKLNEIACGALAPDPVAETAFSDQPAWLYSIDVQSLDEPGMIAVRVVVRQDLPPEGHPVEVSVVRWMVDPNSSTTSTDTSDTSGSGT